MRSNHLETAKWVSVIAIVVALATMFSGPVLAGHGDVSLVGSDFEIDNDANLKQDHLADGIDWATMDETRKADEPSGQTDDSFGQGTKEDTETPTIVDGSIRPNKSDLKTFGVFEKRYPGKLASCTCSGPGCKTPRAAPTWTSSSTSRKYCRRMG